MMTEDLPMMDPSSVPLDDEMMDGDFELDTHETDMHVEEYGYDEDMIQDEPLTAAASEFPVDHDVEPAPAGDVGEMMMADEPVDAPAPEILTTTDVALGESIDEPLPTATLYETSDLVGEQAIAHEVAPHVEDPVPQIYGEPMPSEVPVPTTFQLYEPSSREESNPVTALPPEQPTESVEYIEPSGPVTYEAQPVDEHAAVDVHDEPSAEEVSIAPVAADEQNAGLSTDAVPEADAHLEEVHQAEDHVPDAAPEATDTAVAAATIEQSTESKEATTESAEPPSTLLPPPISLYYGDVQLALFGPVRLTEDAAPSTSNGPPVLLPEQYGLYTSSLSQLLSELKDKEAAHFTGIEDCVFGLEYQSLDLCIDEKSKYADMYSLKDFVAALQACDVHQIELTLYQVADFDFTIQQRMKGIQPDFAVLEDSYSEPEEAVVPSESEADPIEATAPEEPVASAVEPVEAVVEHEDADASELVEKYEHVNGENHEADYDEDADGEGEDEVYEDQEAEHFIDGQYEGAGVHEPATEAHQDEPGVVHEQPEDNEVYDEEQPEYYAEYDQDEGEQHEVEDDQLPAPEEPSEPVSHADERATTDQADESNDDGAASVPGATDNDASQHPESHSTDGTLESSSHGALANEEEEYWDEGEYEYYEEGEGDPAAVTEQAHDQLPETTGVSNEEFPDNTHPLITEHTEEHEYDVDDSHLPNVLTVDESEELASLEQSLHDFDEGEYEASGATGTVVDPAETNITTNHVQERRPSGSKRSLEDRGDVYDEGVVTEQLDTKRARVE